MSVSDTRLFATPAGVRLCPIAQIADGKARNFVLQMRAGRFHGFAVRDGDHVAGFVDQCPHAGLPRRPLCRPAPYALAARHGRWLDCHRCPKRLGTGPGTALRIVPT